MRQLTLCALACWFCISLVPCNAFAVPSTGYQRITRLSDSWVGDGYGIQLENGTVLNPAGCSIPDSYVVMQGTNDAFREKAALLMGAFLEGKEVNLYISDVAGDCFNGRPKIVGIEVRDPI